MIGGNIGRIENDYIANRMQHPPSDGVCTLSDAALSNSFLMACIT